MTLTLLGLLVFLIGLNPDLVGMNRSPAVGFVQVGVWLAGLGVALIGGYGALRVVRNGRPTTLLNDVGLRLAATGYVIAGAASLADFIGIGSHTIRALVFGKIQVAGLVVGVLLILVGLILYYPRARREPAKTEPLPSASQGDASRSLRGPSAPESQGGRSPGPNVQPASSAPGR